MTATGRLEESERANETAAGAPDHAGRARAQRRDARRNREALLDAAREVFAERGMDAGLDDVARRAGLGVGTAYRHFATKQDLVAALFDDAVESMTATLDAALAIEDPWEAVARFFEEAATNQANNRGLHEMLTGAVPIDHAALRERFERPVAALFERAQHAGVLRRDLRPNDLAVLFGMMGPVYDIHAASSPEIWRRYLALLLDGLRATERPPLPAPPLADADLDEAMLALKHRKA